MTLLYTYPVDLRAGLLLVVASLAIFYFLYEQEKSPNTKFFYGFAVALFLFATSSLYSDWHISQALEDGCSSSGCKVIEGEVRRFRSHKINAKFRTNEFYIDGRRFTFLGSPSNSSGTNGYESIVEKGGAITPDSYVKLHVYDEVIIRLYKEEY